MNKALKSGLLVATLAGAGALLAACVNERQLNDDMRAGDFGRAYQEDMAAQIADPDATYKGPPPPSNGERAQLNMTRYKNDKVKQPSGTSAGGSGGSSGGGDSGGGGGGSTGP